MKEETEKTLGGVKITIKQIGEGSNAYYRLMVEGSNQGTFSTKKDAIKAKNDYIASLQSRKKRVIPRQ